MGDETASPSADLIQTVVDSYLKWIPFQFNLNKGGVQSISAASFNQNPHSTLIQSPPDSG